MSIGCEGCLTSNRGQQEQLELIRSKAKTYAIEQQKAVAIYREGYEFGYELYESAKQNNYLIIEVLSQH